MNKAVYSTIYDKRSKQHTCRRRIGELGTISAVAYSLVTLQESQISKIVKFSAVSKC